MRRLGQLPDGPDGSRGDEFDGGHVRRWGSDDPAEHSDGLGLRPTRRAVPSAGLRPLWWRVARWFRAFGGT